MLRSAEAAAPPATALAPAATTQPESSAISPSAATIFATVMARSDRSRAGAPRGARLGSPPCIVEQRGSRLKPAGGKSSIDSTIALAPGVGEVQRQPPGQHQHDVEAHCQPRVIG